MNRHVSCLTIASCSVAILGLLATTSCSKLDTIEQQAGKTQEQVSKAQERLGHLEEKLDQTGGASRFQIVVANGTDRGAVLFLIDTRGGETWIYRPPQGPAINGFWSDIPRLTYPADFWQRAFSQGQPAPGTNSQPGVTQPAPSAPPTATR